MRYLPPIPWHAVAPGTVIMDHNGIARTVLINNPSTTLAGHRFVTVEGLPPAVVRDYQFIAVVELDESDAAATLHAAGFTVTPIERK